MDVNQKDIALKELRLGGIFLIISSLLILITILLEYNSGWIAAWQSTDSDIELGRFLYENWSKMSNIWGISVLAGIIGIIASYFLIKNLENKVWVRALWLFFFLGNIFLLISFGITLGAYFPALEVLDQQPAIFKSIRGAALYFFDLAGNCNLAIMVIFIIEGFKSSGAVPRLWAIVTFSVVIIAFILMISGILFIDIFVMISLAIPIVLGISYVKNRTTLHT